jgi:hypothetical protein
MVGLCRLLICVFDFIDVIDFEKLTFVNHLSRELGSDIIILVFIRAYSQTNARNHKLRNIFCCSQITMGNTTA